MRLLSSLLISLFTFACATEGELESLDDQEKFGAEYEEGYAGYGDDQDDPWKTDVADPWADEQEGRLADEQEDRELRAYHHTGSSASLRSGDRCASGCIWSSYAVSMGAQSSTAQCENGGCACVVVGDVWTACDAAESSGGSAGAEPVPPSASTPAPSSYDPVIGGRIADEAYYQASRRGTVGYCYNAAADAIEAVVGTFLYGVSAYMAADQLAAHPRFTEVWGRSLPALPAGAVVVWGRGSSAHGHISIALGDGREASDHIAQQMTYHYGGAGARVFLPR
ncbi:MAG: hypothetical protein VYD19_10900 [Myxococcota bacterium]|nr:hypothetical protein [Myxococcota bacterium]